MIATNVNMITYIQFMGGLLLLLPRFITVSTANLAEDHCTAPALRHVNCTINGAAEANEAHSGKRISMLVSVRVCARSKYFFSNSVQLGSSKP